MSLRTDIQLETLQGRFQGIVSKSNLIFFELESTKKLENVVVATVREILISGGRSNYTSALNDERLVFTSDKGRTFLGSPQVLTTPYCEPGSLIGPPCHLKFKNKKGEILEFSIPIKVEAIGNYSSLKKIASAYT